LGTAAFVGGAAAPAEAVESAAPDDLQQSYSASSPLSHRAESRHWSGLDDKSRGEHELIVHRSSVVPVFVPI